MVRHLVAFFFCVLLSLPSVAQALAGQLTPPASNDADQPVQPAPRVRSAGPPEAPISIARLKVPRKARTLYEAALHAWGKHASAEAQKKLDQALKIDSKFPEALALRGGIEAAYQQWDSAEQSLRAAIQIDPGYSPAYVILAGVYNTQSRYDEARMTTEQALSAGASNWSVQYEIARAMIGKGQYENALAVTEAALRSNHGALIHLAKAHAMLGLGKYPEASVELRTYLHDDPNGDGSNAARDLLQRVETLGSR
ncbi:MAG TPA: tetratricopeptide repeat protein [Candidatus Sulfotelmatobacter sp.]|nr:tetratricopeptide repeat protein [Candidatus Sulfotelmatobacter sp.]